MERRDYFDYFSIPDLNPENHKTDAPSLLTYLADERVVKPIGLAKEAVLALLKYGFTKLNLSRIVALVLKENTASQHLLDRLGFQQEGLLRQYEKTRGQFDDLYMYSLLQKEWHDDSMYNKNTSI